eukprot:TRINITY_DN94582_c0_g1_i1.p1 TRINITY_DN94582_c0_g1~~TRINITY_DN94582_c0_g1_i1.p1  ORF type:complete len:283 (+),score=98.15 TRINITY_DN94582_c0_g1_i1:87-935(+)
MTFSKIVLAAATVSASVEVAAGLGPVVVTGATGKTGSIVYKLLKEQGVEVRGFVRDVKKAADVLGCSKCDESEGIFVGDVSKPETLEAVMKGAESLVILTSAAPSCDKSQPPKCTYPKGAYPVDIDFHGGKNQVAAFAEANGADKQVVLVSAMGTTQPDSFLDMLGKGYISFYKLNLEAFLESSGVPFTILKPCGLADGEAGKQEMLVGHDDAETWDLKVPMQRADVARLTVEAVKEKDLASNLRFDLCAKNDGTPTKDEDLKTLLKQAKFPWATAKDKVVV